MTDFGKIDQYAAFVEKDPFRNGLHYPATLRQLGDVKKRIVDVGCGDGRFPRLMAEQGAKVTGYDIAPEKIHEAQILEAANPLGIHYVVATPETFTSHERFDDATSVLVLPYSPSIAELTEFFRSTAKQLVEHGRFISVVFNPSFSAFGKNLGSRRFEKLEGNNVQVEFIDPISHETQFTSILHQYTKEEYEGAAVEGGLRTELWENLYATREAVERMGEPFWQDCHNEQPYAVHVARK